MNRVAFSLAILFALTLAAPEAGAQAFDFYESGSYAPGIPRPEEHLGYAIGTRHSYYHQYESYLERLAGSPAARRMKVEPYGTSYEGRKLYLVFISSEENIARLEDIRAEVARLRDPRATSAADARQIAAATPAIAWMNFANDGNESAAFETAFQMTYQLVAGEDEATRRVRAEVVTILVPAHNPESHERFVAWYNAVSQRGGNPDPNAAEHHGDWLMDSNDNHYQIDLNRDAFALTQVESLAIVRQIQRWNPQLFIDFHGNPPVFYFPPVARPVNRNLGETYDRGEELYGRAIAAAFDRYGWTYMNREVFDLFYPGYFDSYPSLNGAVGMTFETDGGGNQGLRRERTDGTESSLREAAAKHFTGGMASLLATAEHREQRLLDFYQFRRSGMEEAEREPMKQVVLVEGADRGRARQLVELLLEHGIEVYRAPQAFRSARAHHYVNRTVTAQEFPAGAWVVPMAQPQKRLARTLLEPEAELEEEFVREEFAKKERNETLGRRAGKEPIRFYDTTAWSLPLTFGVEAWWTEDRTVNLERVDAGWLARNRPAGGVRGGPARYGYLFRYDSNAAAKLLAQLLKEEYRAAVLRTAVEVGGETFPPGSILLRARRNPVKLSERVESLAGEMGVGVQAVDSARTEAGPSLGSGRIQDLEPPRVAVATNAPASGRAYGSLWFLFEQILDYPFTPIRTEMLRRVDLSRYDVLIFPDGSDAGYEDTLGTEGVARIKQWIESGGTFVGIRGGAAFAARGPVGWTSSRLLGRAPASEAKEGAEPENPVERTPGAFLRVEMNRASYITFGYDTSAAPEIVMHNSAFIFTPSLEGTNAVTYAQENPRVSGFIWPETEKRIVGTPYLIVENVGRGQAVLFADDPNYRLYWPRLTRLFLNAIFFAPSLR
jgi:hypothetical protein